MIEKKSLVTICRLLLQRKNYKNIPFQLILSHVSQKRDNYRTEQIYEYTSERSQKYRSYDAATVTIDHERKFQNPSGELELK